MELLYTSVLSLKNCQYSNIVTDKEKKLSDRVGKFQADHKQNSFDVALFMKETFFLLNDIDQLYKNESIFLF